MPSFEIRNNEDESLDEIVACHPTFIHIEQMADNHWWMAIETAEGHRLHINFSSKADVKALVEVDEPTKEAPPHHCNMCQNKGE